jgi:hypothetical protein
MKVFKPGQLVNVRSVSERAYAVLVQCREQPKPPYIYDMIIELASTYKDGSVLWQEWRSSVKSPSITKSQNDYKT